MNIGWISIISIAFLAANGYIIFKKRDKVATTTTPSNITKEAILHTPTHQGMPGDYDRSQIKPKDDQTTIQEEEMQPDEELHNQPFDLKQAIIISEILNRPLF